MEHKAQNDVVIEFSNFSFQYFAQSKPTLKNINLKICKGEKVLIVGPSGSGKSTIGNCINGLIPFSFKGEISGNLKIGGKETRDLDIFTLSKKVGTVLQDSDGQFIGLTVAEDIAFSLENDCVPQSDMRSIVKKTASLVNMEHHLSSSPHELSGGQKQRVSLAGVMVDEVDILLFDEPLANLDPKTGQTAVELIDDIHKKLGKTIVIIEHRLEDVLHCDIDRIIVMDNGIIQADMSPDELMETQLLPTFGIREPLYVTALRYAGIPISKDLRAGRIETLQIETVKKSIIDWNTAQQKKSKKEFTKEILRVEDLGFKYSAKGRTILHDVSFTIHEGEMLSIVGSNGAGKSTLAKIICGIEKGNSGNLFLHNENMKDMSIKERSEKIGYVMQNPNQMICKPMIFDEVALGLHFNGVGENEIKERVEKTLEICGLLPFINWPISALSYGQKKRVTIASVLAMNPSLILLDEPTAGQDYKHYTEIMEFLKELNEQGVTILLITHDMHLMLEYTARAIVLSEEKILLDSSAVEALTREDITNTASLKLTSLYTLAQKAGIKDEQTFVQSFIDYETQNIKTLGAAK